MVITVYTFFFWIEDAMRISYDDEIDALYIRLSEDAQECRTLP